MLFLFLPTPDRATFIVGSQIAQEQNLLSACYFGWIEQANRQVDHENVDYVGVV